MLLPRNAPPLNSLGLPQGPAARRGSSSPCRAASTARWWRRCWPTRATTWSGSRCSSTTTARPLARKGACCAGRDIHDARRVAEAIGFPHYVLDYEDRFRAAVVEEFADAYLAGATPVPCIRCNERVKFRDLLETARDLEADCLATGHYVRRVDGPARAGAAPRRRPGARPELFPVRHHPRAARLPALPARRARVQGRDPGAGGALRAAGGRQARQPGHLLRAERLLCRGDREAAARRRRAGRDRASRRPGAGTARGVIRYTVGQRRGPRHRRRRAALRGAARRRTRGGWSSGRARRWRSRSVPVARGELAGRRRLRGGARGRLGGRRCGCARPARRSRRGSTLTGPGRARVELLDPEEGVAPGQACVFYAPEGTRVLGGGWIARAAAEPAAAARHPPDRVADVVGHQERARRRRWRRRPGGRGPRRRRGSRSAPPPAGRPGGRPGTARRSPGSRTAGCGSTSRAGR